ncbi:metallophosphoesterase family protein [Singulisphaera sp. PoT]|uniref:metallophosphoesterase family protein n=1 Tax=Singulisphaera sp. PoT TaxID=3411797 RepID=UPI003BF55F65
MRLLAISDLHGDLESARRAIDHFKPDVLLCCGDWGDDDEVDQREFADLPARLPVLSTFGNHDPLARLRDLKNRDGSNVMLDQGETREILGIRIAAIGGIWAKSHKQPYYVTDEDVAEAASRIAARGPVDILLTHGCAVGLADMTPKGHRGGQRCFLLANQAVAPRLHLCGHLHVSQERSLKDGRQVINVGATPEGSVVAIDVEDGVVSARLEEFPLGGGSPIPLP